MSLSNYFKELWSYNELIKNLAFSDLKLRYRGSVLGFIWSLLNPLLMLLVLLVVFTRVFKFEIPNYPAYLLVGIVVWRLLALSSGSGLISIVSKAGLITKIYFPREILVISGIFSAAISSFLEFLVLFVFLLFMGAVFSYSIVLFPFILMSNLIFLLGLSLLLGSLYVYFRDLSHIWDVFLQVGFYATPIIYPVSLIPEKYSILLWINPMTQFVQAYRDILIYGTIPETITIVLIFAYSILFLILGAVVFKKFEKNFAEEV